MEKYTLYCTPEQTRKALELGAPIVKYDGIMTLSVSPEEELYQMPTAEQMIGWLEEQGIMFNIATNPIDEFKVIMSKVGSFEDVANIKWNKSRKEATLAAIDAALEYLMNK